MSDEKKTPGNMRLVVDNSQAPVALADHMAATHDRLEIMAALNQFMQLAREGKLEALVLVGKMKSSGQSASLVAPSNYRRFEVLGILHSLLHFETQKLTIQRPVEEPPDPTDNGA